MLASVLSVDGMDVPVAQELNVASVNVCADVLDVRADVVALEAGTGVYGG